MTGVDRARVAVLMGGISPEHPVSLASGCGILAELDPALYSGFPVLISRNNEWLWPSDAAGWTPPSGWGAAEAARVLEDTPAGWTRAAFPHFTVLPPADVFFIGLHGVGGEDGRLQGFLEMAGMPFTGSGSLGSALAMDKILSKQLYALAGVPTAPWVVLEPGSFDVNPNEAADRVEREIGLPAVVKHPTGGSSIGVAVARTRAELLSALADIGADAPRLLVEGFVAGRESSCGVLEGFSELEPTEIRPRTGSFFSFEEKYAKGGAEEITPAEFPDAVRAEIRALARRAHAALRLAVYSRTDFIWVPPADGENGIGKLFALETNNLPGFTPTSLLPQQARHAGLSYRDLVTRVLRRSLEVFRPAGA